MHGLLISLIVSAAWPVPVLSEALTLASFPSVRVSHVADGDTVILSDSRRLRLIGVNAPEKGRDGEPDEPGADEARQALADLVSGRIVKLREGRSRLDRYGRILGHLILEDGRNVQARLLRDGHASAVAIPPNLSYHSLYAAAEAAAFREQRGIWGVPYYKPRQPEQLSPGTRGYRFLIGTVHDWRSGENQIVLRLTGGFSIRVPRHEWQRYFDYPPDSLVRAMIAFRGWVFPTRRAHGVVLRHPFMIERCGIDLQRLCDWK